MWITLVTKINNWVGKKLDDIYCQRFKHSVKKYLIDKNIPFVIIDKSYETPTIFITVLQNCFWYVNELIENEKLEWIGYDVNICSEETIGYLEKEKYYAVRNGNLIMSNLVNDIKEVK